MVACRPFNVHSLVSVRRTIGSLECLLCDEIKRAKYPPLARGYYIYFFFRGWGGGGGE